MMNYLSSLSSNTEIGYADMSVVTQKKTEKFLLVVPHYRTNDLSIPLNNGVSG